MLYDFKTIAKRNSSKTLCEFLDERNYEQVSTTGFRVLRRDLTQEENAGNIEYKQDGIYLTVNGQEYKGYIYLKYKKIFQGNFTPPKFHITKCQKLNDEILSNEFLGRYFWHNSNVVDIESRPDYQIHQNLTLDICGYCRHRTTNTTTQEFYNELEESNANINTQLNIELDIRGYVKEWQKISQRYKNKKEYTCEKCNIQMTGIDKRYIHTDHINGNKTQNIETNFECLCILCHCYKDELHRENFGKRRMKRELKSFVDKYRHELRNKQNRFLNLFDTDNV